MNQYFLPRLVEGWLDVHNLLGPAVTIPFKIERIRGKLLTEMSLKLTLGLIETSYATKAR